MKKFIEAKKKDTIGSGFTGYMITTYEHLLECLGEPHDATKEGQWYSGDWKVRAEWAFKSKHKKSTVITIYDYKEIVPVDKVTMWHVGSKGDTRRLEQFFKERGLEDGMPLYSGLGGLVEKIQP
ncbi:MAG TPA: hypothetical protein VGO63_02635 [Candidatus Paceibacterota bacterium]|jgi:hypothetical protein|nr:hypothetical protein [Candidatus Paceibacterota bacterium]